MSLRRIAPGIVIDEGPSRGRITGYGTSVFHAVTFTAPATRPATRKPDKLTGSELREHKRELRRVRRTTCRP